MKKVLLLLTSLFLMAGCSKSEVYQDAINPTTGDVTQINSNDKKQVKQYENLGYYVVAPDKLGFNVPTNFKTTLSSSLTKTQSTIPVSSVTLSDGHVLVMADLGSKAFLTLESGSSNIEIVMCTGLTGTTFSGCSRGLAFYGTSTAEVSANKRTHQAGTSVIMGNVNYTLKEFVDKDSNESVGGEKTFTSIPRMPTTIPTDSNQVSSKAYVDSVAFAGAPDGSYTVKGIFELATSTEVGAGTVYGATGARLLISNKEANSSSTVRNMIPITRANGKLDTGFINQATRYDFTDEQTFASSTFARLLSTTSFFTGSTTFSYLPLVPTSTPNKKGQVIALDNNIKLPAVDGTQLTLQESQIMTLDTVTSANLRNSNDDSRTTNSETYVKLKETRLNDTVLGATKTINVKFTLYSTSGTPTARIYKNGVAIGTERTNSGTYSEDFAGFVSGDLIQVYGKTSAFPNDTGVQDFRFYYDYGITKFFNNTLATPLITTKVYSTTNNS